MPITPEEIRALRQALGLTQVAFAELVGVTSNHCAKWERGERTPSEPAARLMRMIAEREGVNLPTRRTVRKVTR